MILRVLVAHLCLGALAGSSLLAEAWPEQLAWVDSMEGDILINGEAAQERESFPAADAELTVLGEGFATLVLSSGLTIYCGPSSNLQFLKAEQQEYADVYMGGEFQNTESKVVIRLREGRFGFVQPEPLPTSTLTIETRFGNLEGDAKRFAVVLQAGQNALASLEGHLYYSTGTRRFFVAEGDLLNMQAASHGGTTSTIKPLYASGRLAYEPIVAPALNTARRVAFRTVLGEPEFLNAIQPHILEGMAFNDYRLAD